MIKFCKYCGGPISDGRIRRHCKYCSPRCQKLNQEKSIHHEKIIPNVNTATVGAFGELLVAADLISKGYEVFRALSPACSCDLAILKEGKLFRVEVRTRNVYISKLYSTLTKFPKDKGRQEIFAIVLLGNKTIEYIPKLP